MRISRSSKAPSTRIGVGEDTFCGLRANGELVYARAGDFAETGVFATNIASLSVGETRACALTKDGKATCAIDAVAHIQFREPSIFDQGFGTVPRLWTGPG